MSGCVIKYAGKGEGEVTLLRQLAKMFSHGDVLLADCLPVRDVPKEVETLTMDQIEVKSYVGGLAKSFERKAA